MTHASVFSGIGGPEVAASMLGWENMFHCEINPFGRAVLDYWYPNAESYEDITKTDFSKWGGQINVLTGGFPCQPFSYAGQRRGADDDRYLWPFMHRCINQVRPDWVVCENVAGIATMVEQGDVTPLADAADLFGADNRLRRYRLRETFTLERICRDIEADGYTVQPVLIPACAVGAPHRRDRVFIIGRRTAADSCRRGQSSPEQQGQRAGQAVQPQGRVQSLDGLGRLGTASSPAGAERAGCGRWELFPTQSPVHSGNDGLSIGMDGASIPFNKWRKEALKAYGNAIVPQVMYEIFRAIVQVENKIHNIS